MASRPDAAHDQHTRRIRFNAFAINGVGHQLPGIWRHPADRSRDYRDLEHWTRLARLLEGGLFDGLFLADALASVFHVGHEVRVRK